MRVVWFVIDARPQAVRPGKALPVRRASLGGNESNDGTVFQLGGTGQTRSWGPDDTGIGPSHQQSRRPPLERRQACNGPNEAFPTAVAQLRGTLGLARLGLAVGVKPTAR